MAFKRALAALAVSIVAACSSAPAREVKEPEIYERPGIRDYEQVSAVTTGHRERVFYERVYWSQVDALAGAIFARDVSELAAELDRQAAASRVGRFVSRQMNAPVSSGPVGACGGSKYDYVIDEESGGNPNARNPSGAWGCFQIMPGTWAGSCSDLGQHGSASPEAQARCADRLPASAWNASQG